MADTQPKDNKWTQTSKNSPNLKVAHSDSSTGGTFNTNGNKNKIPTIMIEALVNKGNLDLDKDFQVKSGGGKNLDVIIIDRSLVNTLMGWAWTKIIRIKDVLGKIFLITLSSYINNH